MFTKILVPLDGSELAESILPQVETLARDFGAEIVLLRAHTVQSGTFLGSNPYVLADITRYECEAGHAYLDQMAAQLRAKGLSVKTILNDGRAANVILDTAEAVKADLIAITTHGRSGVGRWLMGSVADAVIHAAKVPVLLSRGLVRQHAQPEQAGEIHLRHPVVSPKFVSAA